jgi:hypothetical protein
MWSLWTRQEPFLDLAPNTAFRHIVMLAARMDKKVQLAAPDPEVAEPAPGYRALMDSCLQTDAAARPTAAQLVEALQGMLQALPRAN